MSRRIPPSMWRDPRHRRGLAAEQAALRFLESQGYAIEAHRFRVGRHDLDLVVRRGAVVAFVEVKARTSGARGSPLEAVTAEKRRTLAMLAQVWRLRFGRPGDRYRFDLVAVWQPRRGPERIHHVTDAWRM